MAYIMRSILYVFLWWLELLSIVQEIFAYPNFKKIFSFLLLPYQVLVFSMFSILGWFFFFFLDYFLMIYRSKIGFLILILYSVVLLNSFIGVTNLSRVSVSIITLLTNNKVLLIFWLNTFCFIFLLYYTG